jgi:hypothetical protein
MKRSSGPRKTANLSESIHQQLNMYAIAAAAAGVGVALAQPSEAKVVYTPAHKYLPIHRPFYLDLNHDRINDFKFVLDWFTTSGASIVELLAYPSRQGNGIWAQQSAPSLSCASALPRGTRIGPKSPFGTRFLFMFQGSARSATYCPWNTSGKKQAYLGLKFSAMGKIHFGWARFVTHSRPHPTAELTGYAYETIPGKPIIAGATKGPDGPEPSASLNMPTSEPATLGALAMGAPGLSIWRRKESALQAN